MGSKTKNVLKTILKFVISGGALYIVFRNIDWQQTKELLLSAHWGYLTIATAFFVGSKMQSSYRLNVFFKDIGLSLSERYNLRLYWVGMFYNLFLPGGIGGDGYKVYLLNKQYGTKIQLLIQATLLDRISGLVALVMLAGVCYLFPDTSLLPGWINTVDWIGLVLTLPVFYLIIKRFFPPHVRSFSRTTTYSFSVQLLQVFCAYWILMALGVEGQYLEYQILFLVSSVVAVFPFTIGGVGARELTFILGYQYLGIDENTSVAFSFLFFLITAVVSLIGGFLKVRPPQSIA